VTVEGSPPSQESAEDKVKEATDKVGGNGVAIKAGGRGKKPAAEASAKEIATETRERCIEPTDEVRFEWTVTEA